VVVVCAPAAEAKPSTAAAIKLDARVTRFNSLYLVVLVVVMSLPPFSSAGGACRLVGGDR